uniref:Uncharacterized protein n=1 Tax=Romanomermis culicivorax TaxID=13658 RepID=A0A915JAZ9_ROMCU
MRLNNSIMGVYQQQLHIVELTTTDSGWGWRKTTMGEIHQGYFKRGEKQRAKLLAMVATATVSTPLMPQKWKFPFIKTKSPEERARAINFKRALAVEKLEHKLVKGAPKYESQLRESEIHGQYCPKCSKEILGCKKRQQLLKAGRRGEFEAMVDRRCREAGINLETPGFFRRVWRGIGRVARGSKDVISRPFRRSGDRD